MTARRGGNRSLSSCSMGTPGTISRGSAVVGTGPNCACVWLHSSSKKTLIIISFMGLSFSVVQCLLHIFLLQQGGHRPQDDLEVHPKTKVARILDIELFALFG